MGKKEKYPKIKEKEYSKEIERIYKKYKIPKKRKTFEEICYPKKYKLQIPQKFVSKYINPETPYKGVLVFHRIGAGKTCTAVRIGEEWKKKRKIIVVTPASLVGNFRDELRSQCGEEEYITNKERKRIEEIKPSEKEYKEIIRKSDERIDKYYKIMSYNKFIKEYEEKKINLKKKVLIIDEIQNMISEQGKYYKILKEAIKKAPEDLRVVLLSATPMFDKPIEIALTMNLLKLPLEIPTGTEFNKTFIECKKNKRGDKCICKAKNMDMFKEMIKGYVSYYRGAPPYAFPESKIKYVKCEMSEFQYRSYITVLKDEEEKLKINKKNKKYKIFKEGQINEMPNNFFIGTRIISNVAFPNKGIKEEGVESFKGKKLELENLKNYSIKFYKIMKKIKRLKGTGFIYSNFRETGGLESLIKVLEYHGYKDYGEYGEGKKRYAVWSGSEKAEYKNEIKAVFNNEKNKKGNKIKLILGSSSMKEGVTLKRVQQVHILEPYWNLSRIEQIIGRAVRYCSHKDLEEEKRKVKVYIYMAVNKNEKETIDEYIKKMAIKKNNLIEEFTTAMKEIAIDCTLFKHGNVYKDLGEKDIKCEK